MILKVGEIEDIMSVKTKTLRVGDREVLAHSDGSITFHSRMTGDRNTFGYANSRGYLTWGSECRRYLMHRLIAEAFLDDWDKALQVDHINGDKTDNSVQNLRMVTASENQRSHRSNHGASQYRGVCLSGNKWKASCRVDGAKKHIGTYVEEIDAAIARDAFVFAIGYNLEGLNFPENHREEDCDYVS